MNEIEKKLQAFECLRCQACCRQPGFVYLEPGEAEEMAKGLGLEVYEFTGRYCEVLDRRRLVLRKAEDEACVFLTAEGCSVHAFKPRQCRDFPLRWRTPRSLEYCEGMKACVS